MSTLDPNSGLTCVACRLVFLNAEIQREHYRSDWHRYNLKRQVAELEPITDEQFRSKVLRFKEESEQASRTAKEGSSLFCDVCSKRFNSQNAYSDHLKSKRHLEIVKNGRRGPHEIRKKVEAMRNEKTENEKQANEEMESDDDTDSSGWHTDHGSEDENEETSVWTDYNEDHALPVNTCLFCSKVALGFEKNMEHMKARHDFNVPDKQYCADMEGLIQYLGLKVGAGRVCLYCPETKGRFISIQAAQQHMIDKEHCKVSREPQAMLEFADWYDFSALYDELADKEAPVDDGWTLTLPSGAKIGHRALMRYYKQNIRGVDSQSGGQQRLAIEKGLNQPKALSWIGGQSTHGNKSIVPKGMLIQAAKDIKMMERARRRFELRTAVWSNKLFKTQGRVGDN